MTGLPDRSSDPEVAAIQDELEDLNKRLQTGELNIPPEGQRSPSPEPIYDRCMAPRLCMQALHTRLYASTLQVIISSVCRRSPENARFMY